MREKSPPSSAADRGPRLNPWQPPRDPLVLRANLAASGKQLAPANRTITAKTNGAPPNAPAGKDGSGEQEVGIVQGENARERNNRPSARLTPIPPNLEMVHQVMAALGAATARKRSYRERGKQANQNPSHEQPREEPTASASHRFPEQARDQLRAEQLIARYKRESSLSLDKTKIDPRDFAIWLLTFRPDWKAGTWRRNRNAGLLAIQALASDHQGAAMAMLSEDGRRKANRARRVDRRTVEAESIGAKSATRIEYIHFAQIRRSLRMMSRSTAVDWLYDWLLAGISTGLTPDEWPLAQLKEVSSAKRTVRAWLHVFNPALALASDLDRPYRTLDLSEFRMETLEAVRRTVDRASAWALEGKWHQRRSECSQLLYWACKVLFPQQYFRYTLHTLRHQFVANMKQVMTEAEVCALTGSFEAEPEPSHLIKRRAAWNRHDIDDVPRPIEQQLATVRRQLELIKERSSLSAQRRMLRAARKQRES